MASLTLGEITIQCLEAQRHAEEVHKRTGPAPSIEAVMADNTALRLQLSLYRMTMEKDQQEMDWLRQARDEMEADVARSKDETRRARRAVAFEKDAHYKTELRMRAAERVIGTYQSAGKQTLSRCPIKISPTLVKEAGPEKSLWTSGWSETR